MQHRTLQIKTVVFQIAKQFFNQPLYRQRSNGFHQGNMLLGKPFSCNRSVPISDANGWIVKKLFQFPKGTEQLGLTWNFSGDFTERYRFAFVYSVYKPDKIPDLSNSLTGGNSQIFVNQVSYSCLVSKAFSQCVIRQNNFTWFCLPIHPFL